MLSIRTWLVRFATCDGVGTLLTCVAWKLVSLRLLFPKDGFA